MSARRESNWWMLTAKSDLHAARVLADAGVFHLCAFHAQQGAEKALEAVLSARGQSHRTPACTTLFGAPADLGVEVSAELSSAGRRLDLHYVQSRYPNGLGGDPTEYYDSAIAEEALELAQSIVRFAEGEVAA